MVQVIDRLEDAGGAEYIHFKPYRSPRDPNRILANWGPHGVDEPGRMASLGTSVLGTPVELEFKSAYNEAVQYGVRVPVERDHGFRWKVITQSGGT